MTKLCVSLTHSSYDELTTSIDRLPECVDAIELRLDLLHDFRSDWQRCVRHAAQKTEHTTIVTNRPTREGGHFEGEESLRLKSLRRSAELGADYVDIELESCSRLGVLSAGTGRIVSYHNYDRTPDDLDLIYDRLLDAGADVPKVAVKANDITDSARILQMLDKYSSHTDLIALAMGEEGQCTRILAPKFGAFLSFCSVDPYHTSAPGQVSYRQMEKMYRFDRIGPDTQIFGVIANPVAHSMSPAIHNAAFAEKDMNAVYLPLKVADPASFLDYFQQYDLRGLSVTIPHKETVVPLMDELDELSKRIGAVNTIDIRDNKRFGSNTDAAAALGVLENAARTADMLPLAKREVLLVGAGGAARALAHVLADKVGRLVISNRTHARAVSLAEDVDAETCKLEAVEEMSPDILINTTSVGMHPNVDQMPVPVGMLQPDMVVFDAVYNPIQTRLLETAEETGCTTASGFEWFVSQAASQFETWTEESAPRSLMADVVKRELNKR